MRAQRGCGRSADERAAGLFGAVRFVAPGGGSFRSPSGRPAECRAQRQPRPGWHPAFAAGAGGSGERAAASAQRRGYRARRKPVYWPICENPSRRRHMFETFDDGRNGNTSIPGRPAETLLHARSIPAGQSPIRRRRPSSSGDFIREDRRQREPSHPRTDAAGRARAPRTLRPSNSNAVIGNFRSSVRETDRNKAANLGLTLRFASPFVTRCSVAVTQAAPGRLSGGGSLIAANISQMIRAITPETSTAVLHIVRHMPKVTARAGRHRQSP